MNGRKRISRRVLRQFLSLAAATFALGANAAIAPGDGDDAQPANGGRDEYSRSDETGDDGRHGAYRHTFALAPPAARVPQRDARAHVRVLDAGGRRVAQLALHGASMVGPFDHGAYTVLLRIDGLTEIHRIRIGVDTLPYLHFTESV